MVAVHEETTAVFDPLPWQIEPWRDKSPYLLLHGGAGGGKSRLYLEKVHAFCMRYEGATGLIMRKAMDDVKTKTLPFFEAAVLGKQLNNSVWRTGKNHYRYSNGSALFWGGMWDTPQREAVKGIGLDAGLDIVFFEEATAFEEEDFEVILSRMRGKAAGWTQVGLATNPGPPNHWINQRLIIGGLGQCYVSFAEDNYYNPERYKEALALMTGVQYQRLVLGKWIQAEGAIYDNFDATLNVSRDADYNPDWPVRWGVDDGYAYGDGPGHANYHPRVILFMQQTPQGGINIFDEYVKASELPEVTLNKVLLAPGEKIEDRPPEERTRYLRYKPPELASVDSSATELRRRIGDRGIMHSGATHPVSEGIKLVRRYICDGQGVRLLQAHPRCTNYIQEKQSYSYDPKSVLVKAGEPKPLKVDDHTQDAERYGIWSMK
jgi:phage terminase large subunit